MTNQSLLHTVVDTLENLKAIDIKSLEVTKLTPLNDYMVVVSGTSSRHVQAIGENLLRTLRSLHVRPCRMEKDSDNEWLLIDVGDVVVHIMHPRTRATYNLESLWSQADYVSEAVA